MKAFYRVAGQVCQSNTVGMVDSAALSGGYRIILKVRQQRILEESRSRELLVGVLGLLYVLPLEESDLRHSWVSPVVFGHCVKPLTQCLPGILSKPRDAAGVSK